MKTTRTTRTAMGDLVLETLLENPHLPSRSIARMLVAQKPEWFPELERARGMVRAYRGQCGKSKRNANLGGSKAYRAAGSVQDGWVPLPPSIGEVDQWEKVRVEFDRALLLYDVHVPFHRLDVLEVALAEGKRREVDAVIFGGDLCDFYGFSSFDRDPSVIRAVREVELVQALLEHVRDRFGKRAEMVLIEGNHEERLWRYLWRRCPEFVGFEGFDLAGLLHASDCGLQVVSGRRPVLVGPHLHLLHGHEFAGHIEKVVNPARGLYNRAKTNAICGHMHQTSAHTETGLANLVSTWSVGCLCGIHPPYMPINKWNHGFAVVELNGDAWTVDNLKVVGGKVV